MWRGTLIKAPYIEFAGLRNTLSGCEGQCVPQEVILSFFTVALSFSHFAIFNSQDRDCA